MKLTKGGRASIFKAGYGVILLVLAISIILISACSSEPTLPDLPSGQVKGVLTFEEGQSRPSDIFLGAIRGEKIELNTSWQSPLSSGVFLIVDVPPGKYCLIGFWNTTGSFGYLIAEGRKITFEILQDIGIYLKSINVSEVDYLNK